MDYLSSNKILIVDLNTGETSEEELDDDLVSQKIGGVGITSSLYETYKDRDPIILGSGLLTGTLFPASALAVISAKSPRTGYLTHSPVTLKAGMELKYTGFDYVVILGKSEKPVFLWLHDGVADVQDASELWGKDVWNTTDLLRKSMGDDLIQTLVIGQAGEEGSDLAQVCVNYWANGDCWGFGKVFGKKNLKAVALRGMGLLEISDAEDFVDQCFEIYESIKGSALAGKRGVEDILIAMGENDAREWLAPVLHRHSACYNTPYPTNTFIYLDEDPKMLTEPDKSEPGFMITDIEALLALKKLGFSAADAGYVLRACSRRGVDPAAVAEIVGKSGQKDPKAIEQSLVGLQGTVTIPEGAKFSSWAPEQPIFGDFGPSGGSSTNDWWTRRQAVAYLFGIHPIFANMSPELSEEIILEMINKGTGLELSQETVDQVIADVCT
ncbi:aldehyde ferredoxin oxidoreductase N-terminal domain-containing protein [Desulfomonile tiedjei]|uniref:Aldehyde:ferredoxin oxidoreductase n=1 Tax=Desulfomonile tiedjei (strain ATCC 49306 / DSM 6799 / DCB-1) TaxID=706587 RepID=I4CEF0_DESTA|nr:aldehyde ferredoxin oxidoreductase N-terminal domain-containing protein [Desulfomonile tiedjei]AFM27941.1 aldehyde:ferredoxin oxidoreductase [Desulfomonile tiedjei DSM 6799]